MASITAESISNAPKLASHDFLCQQVGWKFENGRYFFQGLEPVWETKKKLDMAIKQGARPSKTIEEFQKQDQGRADQKVNELLKLQKENPAAAAEGEKKAEEKVEEKRAEVAKEAEVAKPEAAKEDTPAEKEGEEKKEKKDKKDKKEKKEKKRAREEAEGEVQEGEPEKKKKKKDKKEKKDE